MEKKNTILLTVIAIATLLVAVVGATFAYFTAQVTSDKADENNQTNVTTAAFASAAMDMGDKVTATDIAPGAKVIKVVEVKGTCPASATNGCTAVNADVKITQDIPAAFGTDVTWKLYKSTDIDNPDKDAEGYTPEKVTCEQTLKGEPLAGNATTNKYYTVSKCTKGDGTTVVYDGTVDPVTDNTADLGTEVTLVDKDGAKVYTDKVEGGKTHYFYLVVDYANKDAVQDQQGLNFTIDIDFVPSTTINGLTPAS